MSRSERGTSWLAAGLFCLLAAGAADAESGPCTPTDRAPETIEIRAQPLPGARPVASVKRDGLSAVRLDAVSRSRGDEWLRVRAGGVEGWVNANHLVCRLSEADARAAVSAPANSILKALGSRAMETLASYAHPVKGVRFSPYGSVDTRGDVILTAAALKQAMGNTAKRTWGSYDGSGAPIRLTFAQYFRKFVYDRDFANAPRRSYNALSERSSHPNGIWDAYPNGTVAGYHFAESARGADWASLYLVFEQHRGKWYLAGIVHDSWTI